MPRAQRRITPADILDPAAYEAVRNERRAALIPVKKRRRVEVGPYATFYFESYDTMWLQIQEMLRIEKGGAEQVADELKAYNPLIPQGRELVATLMFEVDEPLQRANFLARLGGVESTIFLDLGGVRLSAVLEGDVERTNEAGKTSSVHFLHFPFTDEQVRQFKSSAGPVILGFAHANYAHMALMGPETRSALAEDFA